ncbi:MAG TPA: L-threonylcarbamoyladenylate synthase [Actinomycetota bacterium]|nr:L-threonylcarbamoyladenylate synthase [Actinomycetota bacterium]
MAEVFELEGPEEGPLKAAEEALSSGGVVVFPTDTVYGLAGRGDLPASADRLFETKRRPRDLTLPVLVATVEDAATVAVFDARASLLARRFWPGGLTLILPRTDRTRTWDLGEERETVGVRIPDHQIALTLLAIAGPLAVTSANRSGRPTPATCEGIRAELGDLVAVYLCAGEPPGGVPSTVVDLTEAEARILREGAVPRDPVLDAIGQSR